MTGSYDTQRTPAPRLERATLPLTLVAGAGLTVALALGAHFYAALLAATQSVAVEVRAIRDTLAAIDRRVSVLEAPGLEMRIRDIDRRVTTLEAKRTP